MLKLHQHFSIRYALIFLTAIFCSFYISYITLKNIQIEDLKEHLKAQIELIIFELSHLKSKEELQLFAQNIRAKTSNRVTIINEHGIVIAESNKDKIKPKDNHLKRPEIQEAMEYNYGINIRFSNTIKSNFLYVAKEIKLKERIFFLRLAISTEKIEHNILGIWIKIAIIFAFAFVFSFGFSFFVNKRIQIEINKILLALKYIADKSYKTRINSSFSQEFSDISEMIHNLSDKLAKRDKQKRKYAAKLRLINKQRSDIISAISHEFKNPTAAILGYSESLLEEDNEDREIKLRFLNKIVSNANKIISMLDRLTLSTKLENNDLTPRKTNFDIDVLLNEVISNFKTRYPKRKFELHSSSFIVYADSTMIEMVLSNLLENARKYSDDTIVITQKDALCTITDYGEGISENDISKITKKFYRSETFTWNNSMGLGLYLVEYLLKLNNSKLKIKSKLKIGSSFSFELSVNNQK